jgi:hypothetical protein
MAAREGQGLQIAVIIFAMLTIILAITTYMFYAQAQTAEQARAGAVAQAGQDKALADQYLYRLRAYQYVLGSPESSLEIVNTAKRGQTDAEVDSLLANYDADMALIEAYWDKDKTPAKNYRTMGSILLNALGNKNESVTTSTRDTRRMQVDFDAKMKDAETRAAEAAKARDTAATSLATEKTNYDTSLADINKKIADQATALATTFTANKTRIEGLEKDLGIAQGQVVTSLNTIDSLRARRKELESGGTPSENPDGKITLVNQRQRMVWIDVGRADGLQKQVSFSVFDHNENGITSAEPKARIEVVGLSGDHMAECRILEDKASNPIVPGDVIHTPTWSPGQRIRFAIAGIMDVDGDGKDDYDLVRNLITLNGGVIDAELKPDGTRVGEITASTRYFVIGKQPDETSSEAARSQYIKMYEETQRLGIDQLPLAKLLTMMGWKPEERTVQLTGSGAGLQFRARRPGEAGAAPAAAPAAPAADPSAPAAPAVDPFGAPAADPFGAPAAPAAPAADPFGAPAPAAPTAPAADPFATP